MLAFAESRTARPALPVAVDALALLVGREVVAAGDCPVVGVAYLDGERWIAPGVDPFASRIDVTTSSRVRVPPSGETMRNAPSIASTNGDRSATVPANHPSMTSWSRRTSRSGSVMDSRGTSPIKNPSRPPATSPRGHKPFYRGDPR